jgi:hypothetical protein
MGNVPFLGPSREVYNFVVSGELIYEKHERSVEGFGNGQLCPYGPTLGTLEGGSFTEAFERQTKEGSGCVHSFI